MKKFLKWTGIITGGVVGLALLAGVALYPGGKEKLTRSYPNVPVELVKVPADSTAAVRGRHVANLWGCSECHAKDLSGRLLANDPFLGTIPASNLTAGKGGIGSFYTDTDWIRAIRHGIKPDGQVETFMYDYSILSDQDLGDLIAYLKQIPEVDTNYPAMRIGSLTPIAPAVGLFTPAAELIDHEARRPANPVPDATTAYGRYLSAICSKCHGKNLGGELGNWSQEDFIGVFRSGVLPGGKQINPAMSAITNGEMSDTELAALWLYFKSSNSVK